MLQTQYNSIKKVKQNYMFYFFAEVGKRGEGGKNILMASEWVKTSIASGLLCMRPDTIKPFLNAKLFCVMTLDLVDRLCQGGRG